VRIWLKSVVGMSISESAIKGAIKILQKVKMKNKKYEMYIKR
jgi:hypothetical protein